MGSVERVVADVSQSELIGCLGIDDVILNAQTQTQTAVKTLEGFVVERAERLTLTVVLNLSAHTDSHITAHERLYADWAAGLNLILQQQGHFQVVQAVGELLVVVGALAAFLRVEQSCLQTNGRRGRQLVAHHSTDVQACLRVTAIQLTVVRVDGREGCSQSQSVVCCITMVLVGMPGGSYRSAEIAAILGRHGQRECCCEN